MRISARFAVLVTILLGCTHPDPPSGRCRYDEDCATGLVCADTTCRIPCHVDRDCAMGQRCVATDRPTVNVCQAVTTQAGCTYTSDCGPGLYCLERQCRAQCQQDYDCRVVNPFYTCVSGQCVLPCTPSAGNCDDNPRNGCETDLQRNTTHCGVCGHTCASAANAAGVCTNGACGIGCMTGFGDCDSTADNGCEINLLNDATQCGTCGHGCSAPAHASATCTGGTCGFACNTGFGDCDHDPANGCEVDLNTTAAQCGACGNTCASPAHATGTCTGGTCGIACAMGFSDCDGTAANGCEGDTQNDPRVCGACGHACPVLANSVATCTAGACGSTCATGFGDCDENAANGCESDLRSSASSCGTCGTACTNTHGTAVCTAGACAVATCSEGFGDCDHMAANGCEAPLNVPANCGTCGTTCSEGQVCAGGTCTLMCATGSLACGGRCIDVRADTANCGACGTTCPAHPNAAASCGGGTCGFHCNPGFEDCNGLASDGCEFVTAQMPVPCGDFNCLPRPNSIATCAAGSCSYACITGFSDCNGQPFDGCEAELNTVAHCGSCSTACASSGDGGVSACVAGHCSLPCAANTADCDGNAANGCETDLGTSSTNCGVCGNACTSGACSGGSCPLIARNFGGATGIGSSCLTPNDDGSWPSAIDITTAFPAGLHYFANTYRTMYVNNNGNVSFNGPISTFTPAAFPIRLQPMIAPWWADVDTRGAAGTGNNNVCFAVEPGRIAVTWDNVGYYASHVNRLNTFQVLITQPSGAAAGDFDLEFRYTRCEWTTGDASGGSNGLGGTPAQVGFDAGDGITSYVLPMSRTAGILGVCTQSNVGVPGVWRFHIRGGVLAPAVCSMPSAIGA